MNCLTFEAQTGQKLGAFETASQDKNDESKFKAAYDTLDQTKATIKDRYQLTGMEDYSTSGRESKEYELVAMSSPDSTDMIIGSIILGAALMFLIFYR